MKKIIIGVVSLLIVASIAAVLIFVGGTPKHFRGEWKFSKISSVEVTSNVHESWLIRFEEEYGARGWGVAVFSPHAWGRERCAPPRDR